MAPDSGLPIGGARRSGGRRSSSRETQAPDTNVVPITDAVVDHSRREMVEDQNMVRPPSSNLDDLAVTRPSFFERTGITSFKQKLVAMAKAPGFKAWMMLFGAAVLIELIALVAVGSSWFKLIVSCLALPVMGFSLYQAWCGRNQVREVADDAIIPEDGFAKLKYSVYRTFGRPDLVPTVSKAQTERINRANQQFGDDFDEAQVELREAKIRALEMRLIELFNMGVHPIFWVANQKGSSSKSFFSVNGANIIAKVLHSAVVFLMTASSNTQSATGGSLAGLQGKTLTLREYYRLLKEAEKDGVEISFHEIRRLIANTRHGAGVVSEEMDGTDEKANFSVAKWRVAARHAVLNSDLIVWDTGNDDGYIYTVTSGALRMAHVAIIPASTTQRQTLKTIGTTLGNYLKLARRSDNNPIPLPEIPQDGTEIPLLTKLTNAVVVVNAVKDEDNPDEYGELCAEGMRQTGSSPADFPGVKMLGIRYDEYLHRAVEDLDFTQMNRWTYLDYLWAWTVAFETAAELMKIENVPARPLVLSSGPELQYAVPNN